MSFYGFVFIGSFLFIVSKLYRKFNIGGDVGDEELFFDYNENGNSYMVVFCFMSFFINICLNFLI